MKKRVLRKTTEIVLGEAGLRGGVEHVVSMTTQAASRAFFDSVETEERGKALCEKA